MKANAKTIISKILSNMSNLYRTEIILEYREKDDSYTIKCTDTAVFAIIFEVLNSLNHHTLHFYLIDKDTFVIY